MHIKNSNHVNRLLTILFIACATAGFYTKSFAWGHDGHAAVGIISLGQLSEESRLELESILGSVDDQTIVEACNWPDVVRKTKQWEWSYPQHYVNIPPGEPDYSEARDCPDQMCATEAIKKYALELGDRRASGVKRQQAFAWLCHLVGDLHQPLHAGYAHDRGGNEVNITFQDQQMNLHNCWDRALIKQRAGNWQTLVKVSGRFPTVQTADNWTPGLVDSWTEESHTLVEQDLYPANPVITQNYANKSWEILQQRITTAAARLAFIIETVL